jgi:hypothetical protein
MWRTRLRSALGSRGFSRYRRVAPRAEGGGTIRSGISTIVALPGAAAYAVTFDVESPGAVARAVVAPSSG